MIQLKLTYVQLKQSYEFIQLLITASPLLDAMQLLVWRKLAKRISDKCYTLQLKAKHGKEYSFALSLSECYLLDKLYRNNKSTIADNPYFHIIWLQMYTQYDLINTNRKHFTT